MKGFDENWLAAYQARTFANPVPDDTEPDPGPEYELQNKCEKYLKDHAFPFIHDRSKRANRKGILDLVMALPGGRTVWMELKSKDGRATKEQDDEIRQLLFLGHEVYRNVRSYRRFLEIVNTNSSEV